MNSYTFLHAAGLLAGVLVLSGPVKAAGPVTLYFQDFTESSTTGNNVLSAKIPTWNGYISSKAFNTGLANQYQTNFNNDAYPTGVYGPQQSYLSTQGSGAAGQLGGHIVQSTTTTQGASGSPVFASVYQGTSLGINIADYSSLTFTWQQNATATGVISQLMIKVGGSWYVSNATYAAATGDRASLDTATHTKTLAFSAAASGWSLFTLTSSTNTNIWNADNGALSVGAAATSDLTGTIEAIGIYSAFPTFEAANGTSISTRIDQIAITGVAAIPEPANLALIVGLAGMTVFAVRRRR